MSYAPSTATKPPVTSTEAEREKHAECERVWLDQLGPDRGDWHLDEETKQGVCNRCGYVYQGCVFDLPETA